MGNICSWGEWLGKLQSSQGLLRLQGHVQAKAARVAPPGCGAGCQPAAVQGARAGAGRSPNPRAVAPGRGSGTACAACAAPARGGRDVSCGDSAAG